MKQILALKKLANKANNIASKDGNGAKHIIEIRNLSKEFEGDIVLKGVNVNISHGEFVTILGPSGCGKTTLLRIISGFEQPSAGQVFFENTDMKKIPPYKRQVNTIFQNYALFPHMNVFQNVAYALTIRKVPKNHIEDQVREILELIQLSAHANKRINELSGGQKQRVAIARALVNKPKILLLDEPLSALDKNLRKNMQTELKKLQRALGITFILVTHDQEEALTMSDKIIIMNDGEVKQVGSATDIYNEPESRWVSGFIGDSNIIDNAVMVRDRLVLIDDQEIECLDKGFGEETDVDVVIRPEDVIIEKAKTKASLFKAEIVSVEFKGVHWEIKAKTNFRTFLIHTIESFNVGQRVYIRWKLEATHVMWKEIE